MIQIMSIDILGALEPFITVFSANRTRTIDIQMTSQDLVIMQLTISQKLISNGS